MFTKIKTEWRVFIATFTDLAQAIKEQTQTNRTIEASATLRHTELLAVIGEVSKHTKFVADAERSKLQRAGHKHEF